MRVSFDDVLSSDQMPSLPQVALRIVQIAQQQEPDIDDLITTIKTDPAICAKILKTANSALLGLRQRVSSIETGVPILGVTLIRTLVLSFSLVRYRSPTVPLSKVYQRVWRNSITQAVAAETLGLHSKRVDPDTCFLGGLLQDIGILALLRACPNDYVMHVINGDGPTTPIDAELAFLGFTHVDVSVELCRRWGFDETLIGAVSRHHESNQNIHSIRNAAPEPLVPTLNAAGRCAEYLESIRGHGEHLWSGVNEALTKSFDMDACQVRSFLDEVHRRVGEVAAALCVDIGTMPSLDEILATAKAALEEIAVKSQFDAVAARQQAEHAAERLRSVESQTEELREHAYRDPLTGAYNRRFLSNVLEPQLRRCVKRGISVGFLFLDIDKFKGLNDSHGHEVGDHALKTVANVLRRSIRESDLAIRYGGDEFLVALIDLKEPELSRIAKRVCRRIRKSRLDSSQRVRISSSIGAVFFRPEAGASFDTEFMLREADLAMYAAKQHGGDQVKCHRVTRLSEDGSQPHTVA